MGPATTSDAALLGLRWLLFLAVAGDVRLLGENDGHWAFQTIRIPAVPTPRESTWTRTPVDAFVLARLESAGLPPAPPATRAQLLRRVALDLTGLPPTPEEIDAFCRDDSPDAYERLVERLLASPTYGERWARHWLDLARFAETDGFEHDAVRPHSWRYRDYVVRSFNEDKPYDRFIREQLAGDEFWPEEPSALIATGFNLLGPDMVDSADQVQRRLNTLNDMTDTTAAVFLGLTLGCARCHDHKSEPLTQRDYFSLQAFFAPTEFQRERPVPTPLEVTEHASAHARFQESSARVRRELEQLEGPCRQRVYEAKLSKLSEDARLAHLTPIERRTPEQEGTVQETAAQLKVTDSELTNALSTNDRARRVELQSQLNRIPKPASLPQAMVLVNTNGPTPPTFVLARGDYNNPREAVQPDVPGVLLRSSPFARPPASKGPNATLHRRRTHLANWIADPGNPLTARVIVNRVWQHHFGRGIVATPNDFGTRGQPPTHPELLDWLAHDFVSQGWSIKRLHRLILLSATYRQSSEASPGVLARDPANQLLARQNRVRLEGEVLRDSLMAISGRLDSTIGGPGVFPSIPADITRISKNWTASPNPADHHRRSLYIFARRNLRFPFLEAFDAPDSNLSCPERGRSTTAPQALSLLNSDEVVAASQATALRISRGSQARSDQVRIAFTLILGRAPTPAEASASREFLTSAPLSELCRALFNLNAFVHAE